MSHVPRPTEGSYRVKFDVPIRQTKRPFPEAKVNAAISKGMLVKQVRATYPEFARHNRIEGTVVFEAVISDQGEVASLRTSSGPFVLIEAAYEAVKQWQYKPYLLRGQPVEILTVIEAGFHLN